MKLWTFDHMTKLLIGLRGGDWATKMVHQTLKPDGTINYEYEEGLANTTFSYVRGYSTTSDGHGGTTTYQLFREVVTYKDSFFTFPYATNATLIWKCSAEPRGGSSNNTKHVWGTMPVSITNGAIQVPPDMVETICDEACRISNSSTISTMTLSTCYLLVDFAFPARLDGITWNWQPTYT